MGKRKFCLSVHRKNEERKKVKRRLQIVSTQQHAKQMKLASSELIVKNLTLSIPLHYFTESRILSFSNLRCRITSLMDSSFFASLHPSWKVVSTEPTEQLTLCKLEVQCASDEGLCGHVILTLNVNAELKWTLYYLHHHLSAATTPLLSSLPDVTTSVTVVIQLIDTLDSSKYCVGNPDIKFIEHWQHKMTTLHGISSKYDYHQYLK